MRILLVADEENLSFWDHYMPDKLKNIDLILSAGDLKAEYLSFLVTMANCPLLYVHGNHDGGYATGPPEGADCIDGRLVQIKGFSILGLGGSMKYSGGPHQYTERQMEGRIHRLSLKLLHRGADIVLTHAPAAGLGDADDLCHRGFESFRSLMEKYRPQYFVHGHIHRRYGHKFVRSQMFEDTEIINASGSYFLEI